MSKFLCYSGLLIILTMLTGCGGESSDSRDILPLAVGNRWVYDVKEEIDTYSGMYSDLVLTDTTCSAVSYTIEIISESENHYIAAYQKKDATGNVLEEKSIDFDKKEGDYLKDGRILLPTENMTRISPDNAVAMFYDIGNLGYEESLNDPKMAEYTFNENIAKLHYDYNWCAWDCTSVKRSGTILYLWQRIDDEYRRGIGLLRFSMNTGTGGCAGSVCGASGTSVEGFLKNYVIDGYFYEVDAETDTACGLR